MAGIEWTDRSDWNPIRGCTRESEGCRNCYAEAIAARFSGSGQPFEGFAERTPSGPRWTGKIALIEDRLTLPLRWRKPARIFVNSAFDLFHESVPDEWIDRVFAVMALSPQHTFQVLTKRAKRMREYISRFKASPPRDGFVTRDGAEAMGDYKGPVFSPKSWPLPNVWLGVSAEDQTRADERVPELLATPAAVRFVSAEPLLGPIDFSRIEVVPDRLDDRGSLKRCGIRLAALKGTSCESGLPYQSLWNGEGEPPTTPPPRLDWIIVGGESGRAARPMHPDWPRAIRDQCAAAGVPFFFKQWGEWHTAAYRMSDEQPVFRQFTSFQHWVDKASTWIRGGICLDARGRRLNIGADFHRARDENAFPVTIMHRIGKTHAGRLLDGRPHDDMPKTAP